MKILMTNDDGYSFEGLQSLANRLKPHHDVWIIAPHKNRSAVSHGIIMFDPLHIEKIKEQEYSYAGLPADCVSAGVKNILKEKPDVVISGINAGYNLGTDTIYSGTVAAARQAAILGIPSIALSLEDNGKPYNWKPLCEFLASNLETLVANWQKGHFININAPQIEGDAYQQEPVLTDLSERYYDDKLQVFDAPYGCRYTFFESGRIFAPNPKAGTDSVVVEDGKISVSFVSILPKCVFPDIKFCMKNK